MDRPAHDSTPPRTRARLRAPRASFFAIAVLIALCAPMAAPATNSREEVTIDSARSAATRRLPDLEPGAEVPWTTDALASWARQNVRGLRVVDLAGLDPLTARELVSTAALLSQALEFEVAVIVPAARWNETTGQPSADSPMFANRFGVGFDAAWWSSYRALATGASGEGAGPATDPHVRLYAAHELAHVWEDSVSNAAPEAAAGAVRVLVEAYRVSQGGPAVTAELGEYAWAGSRDRTADRWRETWAEAFARYAVDRSAVSAATRSLVQRALLLGPAPLSAR